MVDNVSFSGSYNAQVYNSDLDRVAKYVVGTNLVSNQENPFDGMGLMLGITGAMEGFKVGKWALDARKKGGLKQAWTKEKTDFFEKGLDKTKEMFANGGATKADTYKTVWNNYSAKIIEESIPLPEKMAELEKSGEKGQKAVDLYKKAKEAIEGAVKDPAKLKEADKAIVEANALAHGQIKPTGFGKVGEFFGKITGVSKLSEGIKNLAIKSPTVEKMLKYGKGNGLFLAISGGVELFTQVIPSFAQLGAGKGIAQLAKSTVKTAASIGGWSAGAAVGGAIGTLICPGAGSIIGGAVGALLGIVGGSLGSWAAGKVAEGIVGENELDIDKEKTAKAKAEEAKQDPSALIEDAAKKLKAEGTDSEDAKIAFKSLQRISTLAQVQPQSQPQSQPQPQQVAFSGNKTNTPFLSYSQLGFTPKSISSEEDKYKDFMSLGAGLV